MMNKGDVSAAKITAIGTVSAAIIGAMIAGIFLIAKPEKGASQNVNNSPCGIVQGQQINCNNPPGEPYPVTSQTPTGSGPWPFRTVNTWGSGNVDKGAVVRPCIEQDCGCKAGVICRLGVAKGNTTVYAKCLMHSNFSGVPNLVKDSVWYGIKWPNNRITSADVFVSSLSDQYSGWILGSFLAPEGHNGNIPECVDEQ